MVAPLVERTVREKGLRMIQARRIPDPASSSAVSRRRFIQAALGAAGSVAVLSACGGAATAPPPATVAQASTAPVVSAVAQTVVVTSAQVKTVTVAVTQTVTASAAAPAAVPGKVRFSYTPGVAFDKVYQGLASQFQQQHSGTQVSAEGTWNWDNNKFIVQAAGGKVGMVYNGIYFWNGYKQNQSLDFDITFIPHGPKSNATNLPTDGLVMWKGSRVPDLAWQFMKFLVSQPAEEQYVTGGVDGMPVNKAAAQLVLKQPGPPANKQAFYDVFQSAKPTFTDPYGQAAIGVLQDQGKFGNMWNNDLNVHDTLTAAVPLMNKSIADQIANQKKNQ
jgi:hypothetical protein